MSVYLKHFGISVNPFGLSPKIEFLYKSESFEESMSHFIYGLDNQEPIVMITGAIGTGKTMSLQSFLFSLSNDFSFALITNTQVTPIELLKLILEDLDIDLPKDSDKSDLLIIFKNYLIEQKKRDKRVLVFIDEAQNLSDEVLEEIRLLTNLGQGDSQPVQLFLVGQPELEGLVNQPKLAQLRQRIRVHYRVEPLSSKELKEYVRHRMAVAGAKEDVFTNAALEKIYKFSGGVPRLVNSLAGEGLLSAYVDGASLVNAKDVTGEVLPSSGFKSPSQGSKIKVTLWSIAAVLIVCMLGGWFLINGNYLEKPSWLSLGALPSSSSPQIDSPVDLPTELNPTGPEDATLTSLSASTDDSKNSDIVKDIETNQSGAALALAGNEGVPEIPAIEQEYFVIHICSFKTNSQAEQLISTLSRNLDVGIFTKAIDLGEGNWFRVFVGPFTDQREASLTAQRLTDSGVISYSKIMGYQIDSESQ